MWNELHDFLKQTNQTTDDFGAKIGVKGATVRRYIAKTRRPGPQEFRSIYQHSDHQVEPNSFYDLPSPRVVTGGGSDPGACEAQRDCSPLVGAVSGLAAADGQLEIFAGAPS